MSITGIAGVASGLQPVQTISKASVFDNSGLNQYGSSWYSTGVPPPNVSGVSTTTAFGTALSSSSGVVAGAIPFYDPGSGNSYLAGWRMCSSAQLGLLFLCDRLWECGANASGSALSPTSTSAQTITSATWPARDENGSTNGQGVYIGFENAAAMGTVTNTVSISYTNSGGTSGHTGSTVAISNGGKGGFYAINVQSGDIGVQSVQSMTLSASMVTGSPALVAFRVIAAMELISIGIPNSLDALTAVLPRCYNGTVPFILNIGSSGPSSYMSLGSIQFTQG